MGWRCYLSVVKKGTDFLNEISSKKDFIPNDWLMLASSQNYREDFFIENVINPRFVIPGEVALKKSEFFKKQSDDLEILEEFLGKEDTLVIEFGEVIDNPDFVNPVSKEHYFSIADKYDALYNAKSVN